MSSHACRACYSKTGLKIRLADGVDRVGSLFCPLASDLPFTKTHHHFKRLIQPCNSPPQSDVYAPPTISHNHYLGHIGAWTRPTARLLTMDGAMRIFFSVGEPSGDLHGSNLIRRFRKADPKIKCVGFGGPKMAEAGCDLHYDLTQKAVMFLTEVIGQLRFFFSLVDQADEYFSKHQVDAVVLIDYPGFNWWIAKKAKQRGIPVFYFGVPQMWAWAPWRVRKMRKFVDHALCKLPFEVQWFKDRNCKATYVGHPYFDQLDRQSYDGIFLKNHKQSRNGKRLITLLPGSRKQEVTGNLPTLIRSATHISAACPDTSLRRGLQ